MRMNISLTGISAPDFSLASARRLGMGLAVGLALMGAAAVHAQWQWLDKDGRKVFSDRPPPADVLDKNILKRPPGRVGAAATADSGAPQMATATPATAPASAASAPVGNIPKLSGVDKELAEKKKKAAEADLAKRKVEEERISKARAENCIRAKNAKTSLDSGVRIGVTNAKGEREVMDDKARAAETARIKDLISTNCEASGPQG